MIYKFTFQDGSEALMHYGVKGMKWGNWNAETRARYENMGDGFSGSGGGLYEEGEEGEEDPNSSDPYLEAHPEMFPTMSNGGENPDLQMKLVNFGVSSMDIKQHFGVRMTVEEYDAYMNNCASCAVVYDLRRRGYNVSAASNSNIDHLSSINYFDRIYEGAKMSSSSDSDSLKSALSKYPDGARGYLGGTIDYGDGKRVGHAVAWEKENGKIVYRDCQRNKKYDDSTLSKLFPEGSTYRYVRLDDKKPKYSSIAQRGIATPTKSNNTLSAKVSQKAREKAGSVTRKREMDSYTSLGGLLSDKSSSPVGDISKVVSTVSNEVKTAAREYGKESVSAVLSNKKS